MRENRQIKTQQLRDRQTTQTYQNTTTERQTDNTDRSKHNN